MNMLIASIVEIPGLKTNCLQLIVDDVFQNFNWCRKEWDWFFEFLTFGMGITGALFHSRGILLELMLRWHRYVNSLNIEDIASLIILLLSSGIPLDLWMLIFLTSLSSTFSVTVLREKWGWGWWGGGRGRVVGAGVRCFRRIVGCGEFFSNMLRASSASAFRVEVNWYSRHRQQNDAKNLKNIFDINGTEWLTIVTRSYRNVGRSRLLEEFLGISHTAWVHTNCSCCDTYTQCVSNVNLSNICLIRGFNFSR